QPGTPDQSALLPALCAGRARGAQMRRILVAFAVLAAALVVPASGMAHPLGNFTVNRFTAVELSGRDVYVHYVLDLAEIPTVQEGDRGRAAGFAAQRASRPRPPP